MVRASLHSDGFFSVSFKYRWFYLVCILRLCIASADPTLCNRHRETNCKAYKARYQHGKDNSFPDILLGCLDILVPICGKLRWLARLKCGIKGAVIHFIVQTSIQLTYIPIFVKVSAIFLLFFNLVLQTSLAEDSLLLEEGNLESNESFTLAVLPDTQFYCDTRLKLSKKWGNGDLRQYFFDQTRWVRDNQKRLKIAFLVHEGDIVQADAPEEWAIAKEAMSILDDKVPYCMCLGNHDMGFKKSNNKYGGDIAVNRKTLFNKYFPRDKFAKRKEFGGTFHPERHDNSWYQFDAAGMKFLIVSLECKPRDEVLNWANEVVAKHPEHRVIILTHAYMKANGRRIEKLGYKIQGNSGEGIWQKLVSKHENIFLVLCGHSAGEAVLTSTGDHGNQIHQVLSDYQHMHNGGESWMRYMVFEPSLNKIKVYTYNPALNKFRTQPSSRFDLDYLMK